MGGRIFFFPKKNFGVFFFLGVWFFHLGSHDFDLVLGFGFGIVDTTRFDAHLHEHYQLTHTPYPPPAYWTDTSGFDFLDLKGWKGD